MLRIRFLQALIFVFPFISYAQIDKQIRDENPSLFRNQRLFHSPPNPFFKGRKHNLDFITDIPRDSILSGTLFMKMNSKSFYQEFKLEYSFGLFRFEYDPKLFPGRIIEYYFVLETKDRFFGSPINQNSKMVSHKKLLIDPVQYYEQQKRLNR